MGKPETISSVLGTILEKLQGETPQKQIEALWKEFVGPRARGTRIEGYHKKRLTILVESSGLLHELTFQKEELLQKFEKAMGKGKVVDIQLRIGEIR